MIIFTNGCFDQIHIGHIRLLKFCSDIGRRESQFDGWEFIIGLNSDESVRRLKGKDRPIYPLKYRIEVLESICYVNRIEVFKEDTPKRLIQYLHPDIIVKGGDWKPKDIVGYGLAEIRIFPLMELEGVKISGNKEGI
jgi:rfaE bifunctional protein nucleotidyltransferase chain/domain